MEEDRANGRVQILRKESNFTSHENVYFLFFLPDSRPIFAARPSVEHEILLSCCFSPQQAWKKKKTAIGKCNVGAKNRQFSYILAAACLALLDGGGASPIQELKLENISRDIMAFAFLPFSSFSIFRNFLPRAALCRHISGGR